MVMDLVPPYDDLNLIIWVKSNLGIHRDFILPH